MASKNCLSQAYKAAALSFRFHWGNFQVRPNSRLFAASQLDSWPRSWMPRSDQCELIAFDLGFFLLLGRLESTRLLLVGTIQMTPLGASQARDKI